MSLYSCLHDICMLDCKAFFNAANPCSVRERKRSNSTTGRMGGEHFSTHKAEWQA